MIAYLSIKSQKNGSRLRCDLDEPMAFVMAIGNEVSGECAEGINVGVGSRNKKRLGFAVLWEIRYLSVADEGENEGG